MRSALGAVAALVASASVARAQQPSAAPIVSESRAAPRLTKEPRLVSSVTADFPPGEHTSSVVTLAITIGADGAVRDVSVLVSGGADFDAAAVAAARRFVFEPAEVDGKPAAVKISYRYQFTYEPPPPAAPAPASLEGTVRARATRLAITGATATLGDLGRSAITDGNGHFVMADVPPGTHPLRIEAEGYAAVTSDETIAEGKRIEIDYVLDPIAPTPTEEVEVRGQARRRREAFDTVIASSEARKVAGTQGDTLKVVQNLPGLARPAFGSGQIVVWGSAPKDTRVYVDGVEIPTLFHGSALRSTINSDLVKSVALVPGAYGAAHGRSLGGLVEVETAPLPASGVHGYAGADTLDASGMLSAALGDRVRVGAAARVGYLDRVMEAVSAPDVGDYFPIPRYRDYQAKGSIALRKGEELHAVFLGSEDDLRRTVPSTDPARVRAEETHGEFQRIYLHYTRTSADGAAIDVTPFVGHDQNDVDARFGANPARLDVGTWRYGVRASHRSSLGPAVALTLGADVLGSASRIHRAGSLDIPAREGDVTVFGQPPGDDYATDDWTTNIVDVGPFVAGEITLGPLTLSPGIRVDAFLLEGSRQTPRIGLTPAIGFSRLEGAFEPRLAARWQATPRLAFIGAAGTYRQAPEPEELSAVFGTPDLGLSRATHYSAGESLRITRTLSAEVVGFFKQMSDLVVRSRLTTPKLARALVQDGQGRSFGLQLLLRQEMWRGFFGWASYTISRSERRYVDDAQWRRFDYDQPHVFTLVLSKEIGAWTFGTRFRYARGLPRTPVIGAFYDVRGDQYQPIFGEQNAIRLPDFYQLDVRVDRAFTFGAVKLTVYAEAQNVTFHQNREEFLYSSDFTRRGTITGLPTLGVVGARLEL